MLRLGSFATGLKRIGRFYFHGRRFFPLDPPDLDLPGFERQRLGVAAAFSASGIAFLQAGKSVPQCLDSVVALIRFRRDFPPALDAADDAFDLLAFGLGADEFDLGSDFGHFHLIRETGFEATGVGEHLVAGFDPRRHARQIDRQQTPLESQARSASNMMSSSSLYDCHSLAESRSAPPRFSAKGRSSPRVSTRRHFGSGCTPAGPERSIPNRTWPATLRPIAGLLRPSAQIPKPDNRPWHPPRRPVTLSTRKQGDFSPVKTATTESGIRSGLAMFLCNPTNNSGACAEQSVARQTLPSHVSRTLRIS